MLVAAVLAAAMMMGVTYLYFAASLDDLAQVAHHVKRDRTFYIAEAGVGEAIDHLDRGNGARVIDRSEEDTWRYKVRILDRGLGNFDQEIYEIESMAEGHDRVRTVNAVVENLYRVPVLGAGLQSGARCYAIGNTTLDGRDHDSLGLGMIGPGVLGMAASGNAVLINSPRIGGRGIAPITDPQPSDGVFRGDIPFGDSIDADGDAAVDEELFDGLDNDGDGLIDEDLAAFVTDPDTIFNLPPGTIKRYCERRNTYFDSADDLETYLLGKGGEFPGGEVIYLDGTWIAADFGSNWNSEPSLLVVHNDDGDAVLSNMSGRFKGLIVADSLIHIAGDVEILGGAHVFRRAAVGNPIGLSGALIEYSQRVLEELPRVPYYTIKAWRDVPGATIRAVDPPPIEEDLGVPPIGLQ